MLERLGIRARLVLASALLTLVAGLVLERLTTSELESAMVARVQRDLVARILLAEEAVVAAGRSPSPDWSAVAHRIGDRAGARVTLVAPNGTVIGDSDVLAADLSGLENHAERSEIAEARETGQGTAIRVSPTLHTRMIYVARRYSAPEQGIAEFRVALPLTEVDRAVSGARRSIAWGTVVALAAAALLFGFGAHIITGPVRALTGSARAMAAGNLAVRAPVHGDDEVAKLGRALNRLAEELSRSIEALRAERDLLSGVLDGMNEGVLVIGGDKRIVLANRALRTITLVGEDAIGKSPIEAIRNAALQEALEEASKSDASVVREIELGGLLMRRLLVRISRLSHAEERGLIAVFHDVTDLRRLETIRTDFVANVSHELRTPVTAISTAIETLLGGALSSPIDSQEFAEVIDRHARRLRQLVDDLLDLSKIEAKGFRLTLREAELRPIVEQAVRLMEESARRRRVHIEVTVRSDAARVRVDPRAIEQAIVNLLDNAIKYAGEGAHVAVTAQASGESIEIAIVDDGPGIPPAHLGRVFERFYRVEPGRSRDLGGTGLGLSIVKHLIELMHGNVEVESQPGCGAAFRIRLPRAPRATAVHTV